MKYEIRELGLGGILDQAIKLTRNHFGLLLGIACVLMVPYLIIQGLVQVQTAPKLPPNPTPQDMIAIQQQVITNLAIVMPIAFLGLLFIIPVTNAALIHAIASEYLERPTTVMGSMKAALSRLPGLLGTWILVFLAVFVGFLLCIIPGIIASFWFALATQVFMVEGVAGVPALQRSKDLMTGNIGTFFVLALLVGAISFALNIGAALIPQQHAQAVVTALTQAVTSVVTSAAFVVFYFSCRCRHEQFDLTRLAESVATESPAEGTVDDLPPTQEF